MRPYLAVLKDSFREALSSRVLWILIILTTLLLLLAAPVGIREQKVAQPPTPGTEADESSPTGKTEIVATYLVWDIFDPIPMSRAQATPVIKALLAGIIDFFVGTLGVFAAILVTASIIPHTFEAGAIDLLLSKPVSRSLLYLTKFFGGCAFIALNAGYQ